MISDLILEKLSEREGRHITHEDLSEEEQKTLLEYDKVLSKKSITLDDVRKFISQQIRTVENNLLSYRNTSNEDIYFKATMRNLKMLKAFLQDEETRKRALVGELEKLHGIKLSSPQQTI